jgi:hypothetical protein
MVSGDVLEFFMIFWGIFGVTKKIFCQGILKKNLEMLDSIFFLFFK